MGEYPLWKLAAWRFARVALAAALGVYLTQLDSGKVAVDKIVLSSMVAGVVSALVKALRDDLSEGNKKSLVHKLPL